MIKVLTGLFASYEQIISVEHHFPFDVIVILQFIIFAFDVDLSISILEEIIEVKSKEYLIWNK